MLGLIVLNKTNIIPFAIAARLLFHVRVQTHATKIKKCHVFYLLRTTAQTSSTLTSVEQVNVMLNISGLFQITGLFCENTVLVLQLLYFCHLQDNVR